MTRAAAALFHGDFLRSLTYHPLLIPTAAVFLLYALSWLTHKNTPRMAERMLVGYTIILIALYIMRMIFLFPHTEPLIYNEKSILWRIVSLFNAE